MFGKYLEDTRNNNPLIHNITNYVTSNDVANIILACGARPLMAEEECEVEEITSFCNGLNINIGMITKAKSLAMIKAVKKSNDLFHPVIFDAVGVGGSKFRMDFTDQLLNEHSVNVIKGNISEIYSIAKNIMSSSGVDADKSYEINTTNIEENINLIKSLSDKYKAVIVVTGKTDLVSDDKKCYIIHNGRDEMSKITGTGCQLSGLIASFISANKPEKILEATAAAVISMGLAGEIANENMLPTDGNATYRNRIIDAIYNLDAETLEKGAKYEIR